MLVHSSAAGARQWRKLIELLAGSLQVKAINLYGYGATPAWTGTNPQSLADQAALIAGILPDSGDKIALVRHSFGGAVAMRAAAMLGKRVRGSRCMSLFRSRFCGIMGVPRRFPRPRGSAKPSDTMGAGKLGDDGRQASRDVRDRAEASMARMRRGAG